MAWTFRKRKKILPGVHLNYGTSGVSLNVGVKGASATFGANGVYVNTGIPGTGIRNRHKVKVGTNEIEKPKTNKPQVVNSVKKYKNTRNVVYYVCYIFSYALIALFWILTAEFYNQEGRFYIIPLAIALLGVINTIRLHIHHRRANTSSKFTLPIVITIMLLLTTIPLGVAFYLSDIFWGWSLCALYVLLFFADLLLCFKYRYKEVKDVPIHFGTTTPTIPKQNTEKHPKEVEETKQKENIQQPKYMITQEFYAQVISMTEEVQKQYEIIKCLPSAKINAQKYAIKKRGVVISDFEEQLKYLFYFDIISCFVAIKKRVDWHSPETFSAIAIIARLEDYHPCLRYENIDEQISALSEKFKDLLSTLYKVSENQKEHLTFYVPRILDSKYFKECGDYMNCLALFTSIVAMADGVATEQEVAIVQKISGEKLRILSSKEMEERKRRYHQEQENLKNYGVDQVFLDVAIDGYRRCGVNVFDLHEYLNIDFLPISQAISKMERLGLIDHDGHAKVHIPYAIEQMKKGTYVVPEQRQSSDKENITAPVSPVKQNVKHEPISQDYFKEAKSALEEFYSFFNELSKKQDVLKAYRAYSLSFNGKEITEPITKFLHAYQYDFANAIVACKKEESLNYKENMIIRFFLYLDLKTTLDDLENMVQQSPSKVESIVHALHDASKNLYKDNAEFINFDILLSVNHDLAERYLVHLYRLTSLLVKVDGKVTENESAYLSKLMKKKNIADNREEESVPSTTFEEELNSLIGLESVKKEISTLANFIRIQKEREKKGLKTNTVSYHCVFTGNPGTGKTTVARIVARIYKELGVLRSGHLVETDRSGLIAEYLGQTAVKTNKKIDEALDGILFIDEAYSITEGEGQDIYGKECVATLLKRMEDDRERLVVIVAGYTKEMQDFIQANPGFQSRFNRYIEFPDYSPEELFEIFALNLNKFEYRITAEAEAKLRIYLQYAYDHKDKNFGNGRYVRNTFEKVMECQANRLAVVGKLSMDDLVTITENDIPCIPSR